MDKRIIYQEPGRPMAIIVPADCGMSIEEIAVKDTPTGIPFWIVDLSEIPQDRTFREAWDLDISLLGDPSGIGG